MEVLVLLKRILAVGVGVAMLACYPGREAMARAELKVNSTDHQAGFMKFHSAIHLSPSPHDEMQLTKHKHFTKQTIGEDNGFSSSFQNQERSFLSHDLPLIDQNSQKSLVLQPQCYVSLCLRNELYNYIYAL